MEFSQRVIPEWNDALDKIAIPKDVINLVAYFDVSLNVDPDWTNEMDLVNNKEWLIFIKPYHNNTQPDIVLFHPNNGIQFIQVNSEIASIEELCQEEPYECRLINYTRKRLYRELVPEIGQHVYDCKAEHTISFSVYYANIPESVLYWFDDTNPTDEVGYWLKSRHCFSTKDLTTSSISDIVYKSRFNEDPHWKGELWNEKVLFWLQPKIHQIDDGALLSLTGKQLTAASPLKGHHRIRGVTGSGKSTALAIRAANLASQGKSVLLLTYNASNWHYLISIIKRTPFIFSWNSIEFNHFHGLCMKILTENNRELPKGQSKDYEYFADGIPDLVLETLLNNSYSQYDCILIDEGQDFCVKWYQLLCRLVKKDGELVITYDKAQKIYENDSSWFDKRRHRIILQNFSKGFIDLNISYRFPSKIFQVINSFADYFDFKADITAKNGNDQLELFTMDHVVWRNSDRTRMPQIATKAIDFLLRQEIKLGEITILTATHSLGLLIIKELKAENIEVNHSFDPDRVIDGQCSPRKAIFNQHHEKINATTIHSFKGWESHSIMVFLEETRADDDRFDRLVYTAISRAKTNLVVYNDHPRYIKFGNKLPKRWRDQ